MNKLPEIILPDVDTEEWLEGCSQIGEEWGKLTPLQRRILVETINAHLNKEKITLGLLAKRCDCDRTSIFNAQKNPKFTRVLGVFLQSVSVNEVSNILLDLIRNSENGDTSASKAYLQFAGMLANVTKNLNVNVNNNQPQNIEDGIDNMILKLLQLGIHPEAFAKRAEELAREGRI